MNILDSTHSTSSQEQGSWFAILSSQDQIKKSRSRLRKMGISCATGHWTRSLRRRGLLSGVNLGDELKSWDVLQSVEFIRAGVPKSSRILDIGAARSEILYSLKKSGYANLCAADVDSAVAEMNEEGI